LFAASNIGISVAPFLTRFTSRYNITFSISLAIIFMFLVILLLIVYAVCKNKVDDAKIIVNNK